MGDLTMINSHQVKGKDLNCNVYSHVMGAAVLDVLLMWGAYRSTRHHIVMRMLIRLVWFGALSGGVIFLYVKTLLEDRQGTGSTIWFRIFYLVLGSYAILHLLIGMLSHIPWLRIRTAEWSKYRVIRFIKAVHQERYFVGRGMYERLWDYFRYVLFWVFVLFCKFSFSYHFQLLPMVVPTRLIVELNNINYVWHDFVSKNNHNALTLLALWAPVVMIYFLDVQVWYTVTSALLGGLEGAKDRLGEIRDLSMLRKRFIDYPQALVQRLQPMNSSRTSRQISLAEGAATDGKVRHINMSVMLYGF
jgi:callose synthase